MSVQPSHILIIRVSAIGDVVFASPLIKALRRTYPEARLSWLVEPAAAGLLQHNPDLDEVIVWPRAHWRRLWRERKWSALRSEVGRFVRELRARRFDLAIDVQGLLKSALWAWLTGAKQRIGLGAKEGGQWLMTQVVSRDVVSNRIGAEYLHLAQELKLDVGNFAMDLALSEEDEHTARALAPSDRYAVICPFTTRPQKHWVEARWSGLAQALTTRLGMPVVMLGGPADVEAASRITAGNVDIVDRAGHCSLTQSAALIKHASLLVGVDTGLTHMGIAFNVPTVALFGSTCPYLDTTRPNASVIYHALECSPCRRNPTCGGDFTCMKSISIDEVVGAGETMMAAP